MEDELLNSITSQNEKVLKEFEEIKKIEGLVQKIQSTQKNLK